MRQRRTLLLFALLAVVTSSSCTSTNVDTTAESCLGDVEPTALKIEPGSDIAPPKAVRRVEPIAPSSLLGREATATIEAVIGEDGTPRHICIASGDAEWGQAIAVAFQQWQFEPATSGGKPVAVRFRLTSRLSR